MDRRDTLASLLAFAGTLAQLEAALDALEPASRPVATVRREDVAAVIRRFLAGELNAAEVARWAALVECREDLEFEPRHQEAVGDALFDLANPEEQGALQDIAGEILASLGA